MQRYSEISFNFATGFITGNMKKTMIISLLVLLNAFAFGRVIVKPGYFISHDGDTTFGSFKLRIDFQDDIFMAKLQHRAYFIDESGKEFIFKPNEILSYSYKDEKEIIKFTSIKYYSNSWLFLETKNETGFLKLYLHYTEVLDSRTDYGNLSFFLLSYPNSSEEDFYCLIEPDGSMVQVSKLTMKRKLGSYFADYPELVTKIELDLYSFSDMYWIVNDYNRWKNVKEVISYSGE